MTEEQREFLFRSLDDLEAERAAGGIDEETYRTLHDDYTARAAAELRAEADGSDAAPADRVPISVGRRVAVVGGLVAFAVAAAVALAFALGARLPGETITGNSDPAQQVSPRERERTLEAAVRAAPNDASAHLALARFRLGQQDGTGALDEFRIAAGLDPSDPEPFAYSGWIIRLQGYPQQALELLDKAITINPSYPDAHFFRGFILLRDEHRPAAAIPDFQQYLVLQPDSPLSAQVRTLLAEAVDASGAPTPSTTDPRPQP